jgi:predicted KAP-like P-loop ATPase
VKSELKDALTALNRNIVVLVDDIDRLAADEIKLLFQLIKVNSDFPNLIFFLFFQRDIIERALGRTIRTGTGKDYLEKIVQVPLSLPHIQRPLLEGFMDSKLRDLLARRGLERTFDWSRFKQLWQEGLDGYFQNVRDAVRFFGTLEFQVAAFPDPAEFDPVDLFALEVLRVFEGGVYEALAASRHLLTPDDLAQFQHDIKNLDVTEPWKNSIKQIVDMGKASRPEAVDAVLKSLFPIESFALGLRTPEKPGLLQKQARVGHPAFFGRYFHLCVPQGDIPQTEVLKLLAAIGNPVEFKRLLLEFDKAHLALQALTRLSAYADNFDPTNAGQVAGALYDVGDALVGKYGDCGWTGYAALSCLLIEGHLDKLPTTAERFAVLKSSFERTEGTYLPAYQLHREGSRVDQYTQKDKPRGFSRAQSGVLEDAQLDELAGVCVGHFERAASSGALRAHSKLKDILDWWLQWGKAPDGAKRYFRELIATDDGVIKVLEHYLGGKIGEDGPQRFLERMFDRGLSDFDQFVAVDEFKGRVDELAKKGLSERDAKLCGIFMELYSKHVRDRHLFPAEAPAHREPAETGDNAEPPPEGKT